ncbi:MAG: AmmeMemoRadiSam system protein B [candidate division KSB1 bacterium]|nr:AmmeMemoRadiSam system protein B [candidate division KSB1 bacterium]
MVRRVVLTTALFVCLPMAVRGQRTRGLADTLGFARFPGQMERVIQLCDSLERDSLALRERAVWASRRKGWLVAISPHDDYLYAGRVYWHLFRKFSAPRAILIGVAHRAAQWGEANRVLFDSFEQWRGPWGPVTVWDLRDSLLRRLPNDLFRVCDACHAEEHSLEALIPWMQYRQRNVQILALLVPYMHWGRMDTIARALARSLAELTRVQKLVWGEDFVILISSDAVHYGDDGWGGRNFAPFGVGETGYGAAVNREYRLLREYLLGSVSPNRLRALLYELVDPDDVRTYRITWCGRFSVPFGLLLSYHLAAELGRNPPEGVLLRYDTSLGLGRLPSSIDGLGVTAPCSLRHWVGYAAVVYF